MSRSSGRPGQGKSTALRTLVCALAATHDPTTVQFYCLDFGGGALAALGELPHVGSVAGRRDADLCRRTVAQLESVLGYREAAFRRLRCRLLVEYRRRRDRRPGGGDDPYGDVFLVIDGWATVRQEFEGLEGPITALAAQGLSYGIHVDDRRGPLGRPPAGAEGPDRHPHRAAAGRSRRFRDGPQAGPRAGRPPAGAGHHPGRDARWRSRCRDLARSRRNGGRRPRGAARRAAARARGAPHGHHDVGAAPTGRGAAGAR